MSLLLNLKPTHLALSYVAEKHNSGIPISNLDPIFDILPSNRRLPVIIFISALLGDIQKQK